MKFMVVGLGSMGKRRIRNLKRLGQGDIIGVDVREERRSEAAKLHGVAVCETFEQGLSHRPDAVVISTPPDMHMGFA